jgi:hypothetical protein
MAKGKQGGNYPNPKGYGPANTASAGSAATVGNCASRGASHEGKPEGALKRACPFRYGATKGMPKIGAGIRTLRPADGWLCATQCDGLAPPGVIRHLRSSS